MPSTENMGDEKEVPRCRSLVTALEIAVRDRGMLVLQEPTCEVEKGILKTSHQCAFLQDV